MDVHLDFLADPAPDQRTGQRRPWVHAARRRPLCVFGEDQQDFFPPVGFTEADPYTRLNRPRRICARSI
jgi:hypothetical protein